ncbi:MAG: hypothetical protein RJB38_842 [Pseudomonadota bacterium]
MRSLTPQIRGRFITFEGTEGAGKSTLIHHLERALRKNGITTVVTREPGGVPVAEKIRELILKNEMTPWTELFLYEAARAEHLQAVIAPALKSGAWVLCDRFTDSTLAYQGHARGLPWKKVETLNAIATAGLEADQVIWLDIDPATGLRMARDPNRFEAEGVEFQTRVRAGFLRAMRRRPRHWIRLEAHSSSAESMAQSLAERLLKKFKVTGRASRRS